MWKVSCQTQLLLGYLAFHVVVGMELWQIYTLNSPLFVLWVIGASNASLFSLSHLPFTHRCTPHWHLFTSLQWFLHQSPNLTPCFFKRLQSSIHSSQASPKKVFWSRQLGNCGKWIFPPPPHFLYECKFWNSLVEVSSRGPQNGRRGVESSVPPGFWVLPSTFAK